MHVFPTQTFPLYFSLHLSKEVWKAIVDHVDDPKDLLHLGLTCKVLYGFIEKPLKYRWVVVKSWNDSFWVELSAMGQQRNMRRLHLWIDERHGHTDGSRVITMPWRIQFDRPPPELRGACVAAPLLVNLSHLTISCRWNNLGLFKSFFERLTCQLESLDMRIDNPKTSATQTTGVQYHSHAQFEDESLQVFNAMPGRLRRFSYKSRYYVATRLALSRSLVKI
ncbi:hypothetical protein CALVIDRAFT_559627 [Calocera viscosa TUFC12733]|uniref:F-box domain-containing protein n=1 Tax=Calocera viscosa (strain TUFC12733) TaxID=1330018 RepID=A0A167SE57_CALVF|nr:hypothetical protein CALVIDRAFT_559627 [Calocera viscosa TUFC12733]